MSENVFNFPKRGFYDGEQIVFKRDANGRAIEVIAASVPFKRRRVGPEEGAQQLRIEPLRPVSELLKEALQSQPPEHQPSHCQIHKFFTNNLGLKISENRQKRK